MNGVLGPIGDPLQHGDSRLQHCLGDLWVGFGLLVGEQLRVILRQLVEEVHLLRNVAQLLAPGLEQGGDGAGILLVYFVLHSTWKTIGL